MSAALSNEAVDPGAVPQARRPVRLLHVIRSVDPRGGGPIEGVFSSAEVWDRHGFVRHIVSLDAPGDIWVKTARAPTFAVGDATARHRWPSPLGRWLRYGYTPRLVSWLKTNARDYDAIVINGLWNYSSLGSWRALHDIGAPYFVFPHGMLDPWFNRTYPIKTLFKRLYWRLFEHRVLRDAAGVMYTCEEERRLARESFAPYVAREFVVGYGTRDVRGDAEAQRAAFLAAAPRVRGRRFALFLGRFHEKKGLDLLIEAFARVAGLYPEFDLVIAGPDLRGLQPSLKRQAQALGIGSRLHWPGMLSGDVKIGALRAAEFFVLPSHQENFGVVIAESLAAATPVLITNKINIWREIAADRAGVVVDDTADDVARGLAIMLALGAPAREKMSEAARASFVSRYDLEKNAMDLLRVIELGAGLNPRL